MRHVTKLIFTGLFLFSVSFGQGTPSREQKIADRSDIIEFEKALLHPAAEDIAAAKDQGFGVIRLLPREKYDNVLAIRGGGAYYSFIRSTHEYGYGSDISFEQNNLSVGFAGADYGFMNDLGDVDLALIGKDSEAVQFLVKYQPPVDEPSIRAEQRKAGNYETSSFHYKNRLPAVVGHTYVLRSINFRESDVLVAFKIVSKDTDGALTIFWKQIESFAKPEIAKAPTGDMH